MLLPILICCHLEKILWRLKQRFRFCAFTTFFLDFLIDRVFFGLNTSSKDHHLSGLKPEDMQWVLRIALRQVWVKCSLQIVWWSYATGGNIHCKFKKSSLSTPKRQFSSAGQSLIQPHLSKPFHPFRACLHGGGGPQVSEVTRLGGVTRLSI